MQADPEMERAVVAGDRTIWKIFSDSTLRFRDKIKTFLVGLLYENDTPSLTRVISITAFLAFLCGSAYLMIKGQRWDHYETFAMLTGGGGAATQVANKIVNSIYNSPNGQFPDKGGGTGCGKNLYRSRT